VGNPFFVAEYLRTAVSEGLLTRDRGGRWRLIEEEGADETRFAALGLPSGLKALVERHLDQLDTSARQLADTACVLGGAVDPAVLARAAGDEALEGVDHLIAREVLELTESGSLRFVHDKIPEVAYQLLAPERRRELHRRAAEALKGLDHAALSAARHWLACGETERGAVYLIEAARQAAAQLELQRADELYRQVLGLFPDDTGRSDLEALRCQAWIGLAQGMRIADRQDEALALLDRARSSAETHGLVETLATIHYLRGSLLFPMGDLDGCMAAHELAKSYARRAGAPEAEARALSGLGDAYYLRGRMRSARQHFSACIELCRQHGFEAIEVANQLMLGWTRYLQNELQAGLDECLDSARRAPGLGQHRTALPALIGCASQILMEMGELGRAEQAIARGRRLAKELGARRFEDQALAHLGKLAALRGRWPEARDLSERGAAGLRQSGFAFAGPWALAYVAMSTADEERRRQALAEAEAGLRAGAVSHNYLFFYREAMDVALDVGDLDLVERYATALEDYTRPEPLPWSDFFIARARALVALARNPSDPAAVERVRRLRDEARALGFRTAAVALTRALPT
jgi:tetratricopeptide (TPR) repeat protein